MDFDFTLPGLGRPKSTRPKRVAEAMKNELSILLLQKVRDPRLQKVSISMVEVTPDLKQAKVYFVVPDGIDAGNVRKGLEKARGFFRSQIAGLLNLRYTPELIFYYDVHHEEAERLDEIFRQIAEDKKADDDPA
ncbi:ribosome-binding factor A [bacterium BMS3Bbin14]|nr:ribosome-binding factor A [bacterium BMS3Abin13]GBE53261.1 ribosome-binding factor A [bacterium BMS3Bbin14]HDO30313.1 30S ribosome-binding factor RbfA [Desulfobacteraceae bacterium]